MEPADIRAGLFWLKSRQPSRWGGKTGESELSGIVEIPEADTIDEEQNEEGG